MIEEDNPPNEYSRTIPPPGEVNAKMVQLALSSMATTLESIQRTMEIIKGQHESTIRGLEEAKAIANLAGGIATEARTEIAALRELCERTDHAVGQLALSIQGLDERSSSMYQSVFPERSEPPPDVDLADIVPIRRRPMTGE